jgi:hypothetical protein
LQPPGLLEIHVQPHWNNAHTVHFNQPETTALPILAQLSAEPLTGTLRSFVDRLSACNLSGAIAIGQLRLSCNIPERLKAF